MKRALTDVAGIRVGHYTDRDNITGCTVVLCEEGAVAGVDVRGSAPGTRETDLLRPGSLVQKVHAVLLSGGSAFGLEAAGGVVRYLEERGVGFPTSVARVPIVPAAILFDLGIGSAQVRPGPAEGYAACLAATSELVPEGSVGVGTGATVGHALGLAHSTKGGVGSWGMVLGREVIVAALVAVNAYGDVVDPETSRIVAGTRDPQGRGFLDTLKYLQQGERRSHFPSTNTTLGVVATNAKLSREQVTKVAQMAQDGLARALRPAHTMGDGDTIFALATGKVAEEPDVTALGALAAEVVAQAILRAVHEATSLGGIPAVRDLSW